ncbi:methyltransferase domain-containing protein [Streptomyces triticagri]|uniref:Methyltransferase domain-containing protein n=1 Tax=Streptomyces triticagri TaxID=2293568 RepID=A0A372LWH1_9ACTN|nr:methyltransferase domain-containing protein [Streptomyces triticagri]RFU83032.1 methyltransferase domain-containing protein [Streptomyces triticagri]
MSGESERARRSAERLVGLLDIADRQPGASELRARTYDLLRARRGASVVDVGCGAGLAVAELAGLAGLVEPAGLAELAGQGVEAIGVDPSEPMIAVARERWPAADFRVAGAYELPLPDASVDGYRADKVFHELADPERALAEARRVLVPGGRVVLLGQDWEVCLIDSDDPVLTRSIARARFDTITAPYVARRFRALLLDAGFRDVEVEVHTLVFTGSAGLPLVGGLAETACAAGAVTRSQADGWLAEQRDRAEADRFFLAVPMIFTSASAPA